MSYLYFAAGSIGVQGIGLSVLRARKRGKRPCFVPCCALLRQERRFLFIAAVPHDRSFGLRRTFFADALAESCGPAFEREGRYSQHINIPRQSEKRRDLLWKRNRSRGGRRCSSSCASARQHPLFCRGPAVRLPRDGIQCPHAAGHPPDGGLHPRRGAAVAPGVSAAASAAAAGAEAPRAVACGRGRAAAGPAARLLQLRPAHAAFARVGVVRQAHPRRAV